MQEGKPNQEIVTLHSPGPLPGIPGASHGPGTFLVDYTARTATEILPEPGEAVPETEQGAQEMPVSAQDGQSEGN